MSKYQETHLLKARIGAEKWLLDEHFPNMIKVRLGTAEEGWVKGGGEEGFSYFEWIKEELDFYLVELNPNLENE